MSAIPKKKLCWNCEGNVAKDNDNCPYCGVYLHGTNEENDEWSFHSSQNHNSFEEEETAEPDNSEKTFSWFAFLNQIKNDVLPILLLMSGSFFFLFGTVLFLFGPLTLHWKGEYWIYFLPIGLVAVFFGWNALENQKD